MTGIEVIMGMYKRNHEMTNVKYKNEHYMYPVNRYLLQSGTHLFPSHVQIVWSISFRQSFWLREFESGLSEVELSQMNQLRLSKSNCNQSNWVYDPLP